jgi:hypothetical protein
MSLMRCLICEVTPRDGNTKTRCLFLRTLAPLIEVSPPSSSASWALRFPFVAAANTDAIFSSKHLFRFQSTFASSTLRCELSSKGTQQYQDELVCIFAKYSAISIGDFLNIIFFCFQEKIESSRPKSKDIVKRSAQRVTPIHHEARICELVCFVFRLHMEENTSAKPSRGYKIENRKVLLAIEALSTRKAEALDLLRTDDERESGARQLPFPHLLASST